MKRFMVLMTALAMVFTASASAQSPAPSTAQGSVPGNIQLSPSGEIGKKDVKKTKMTKKTKRESAVETETKAVVK
jgi:hypothetical protein